MANRVQDDAFARYVLQTGMAKPENVEEARQAQDVDGSISLAEALVRRGVITPDQRDVVEKRLEGQGPVQQLGVYKILKKQIGAYKEDGGTGIDNAAGRTDLPVDQPYRTFVRVNYQIPPNVPKIRASVRVMSTEGTIWVDDLSLKRVGDGREMLLNPSFEK